MTRVLSELLEAREPHFRQSLQQMEQMAGLPRADIRLSSDIQQGLYAKLRDLGLDGRDTTGQELYAVMHQRLLADETRFVQALHHDEPALMLTGATQAAGAVRRDGSLDKLLSTLREYIQPRECFAMKPATAKRLLKANLPRKTMKVLGYRSVDSMLKHETASSLFAAAWLVESNTWAKKTVQSYGKLKVTDFEMRELALDHPQSPRWLEFAETVVAVRKQHILSFKELGAVVVLPLPEARPPLSMLTTAVLTLHAVNEVRAGCTFLKLQQMQRGFGAIVQRIVLGEPMLPAQGLDQPISWHSLHQLFSRFRESVRADIFEPLLAVEEMAWLPVEHVIGRIAPALEFWQGTDIVALRDDGQTVSCNLTDALLSHGNGLPFEQRVSQYFRQSLQYELLLRYLSHDKLEQALFGNVQKRLAPEFINI